jgi:hypothetical protein
MAYRVRSPVASARNLPVDVRGNGGGTTPPQLVGALIVRPWERNQRAQNAHPINVLRVGSLRYALLTFYQSPIPGIGVSFSDLITDQTEEFANILDARSLELVFDHLDQRDAMDHATAVGLLPDAAGPIAAATTPSHTERALAVSVTLDEAH